MPRKGPPTSKVEVAQVLMGSGRGSYLYEDTSVTSSTSGPHTIVDQAGIYLIYFLAIGLYDVSSPFNMNTNNTESGIFVSGQIELFVCF